MYRYLAGSILSISLLLTGCDDSPTDDVTSDDAAVPQESANGDSDGISVKLPGIEIDVDEKEGVKVKAPGTDVSVSEDGVEITAPNVEIKTTPEEPQDPQPEEAPEPE